MHQLNPTRPFDDQIDNTWSRTAEPAVLAIGDPEMTRSEAPTKREVTGTTIQLGPLESGLTRERADLISALELAVRSDSGRTVLVVFGFEGLNDYVEMTEATTVKRLFSVVEALLNYALAPCGTVFRSRRGEYCALLEGGINAVRASLVTIPSELDEYTRPHGIRVSLGIAVLPDEATTPTYALGLADRRLRALSGNLRPEGVSRPTP